MHLHTCIFQNLNHMILPGKVYHIIPIYQNIDAITGALITLSLSILILNSQCEEGDRDDIDIWYMGIIILA